MRNVNSGEEMWGRLDSSVAEALRLYAPMRPQRSPAPSALAVARFRRPPRPAGQGRGHDGKPDRSEAAEHDHGPLHMYELDVHAPWSTKG
ncbi:hypothetical protein ACFZDJ_28600 [Streptomyces sp. NPDC007896]|uniref:hypothetical protein n=1 Tax=Streptomyces sp. NPDC007896 TaxID=3364784 RepID=UPI0036EE3F5A